MSFLSDIAEFLGFQNPAEAASPYLEQIPGQIKGYYEPYIQAGQQALPGLQEQLKQLLSDPGALMAQLASGFQSAPGTQYLSDQAIRAANQAAAAGGMGGTPAAQWDAMNAANQIASQDYNNYLKNVLGLYGTGLSGTQGMATQGLQAGGTLADQLANIAGSQANLAYAGAQANNQAAGGVLGALGSLGGALAGPITGGLSTLFSGGGAAPSGGSFGPSLYPASQGGTARFGGFL